jgi:hypothetical protein
MLILKRQGRVTVDPPTTPLTDLDQYILLSYTHCLPFNGVFSPEQFAQQVRKVYSLANEVNAVVHARILEWDNKKGDELGV